MGDSFCGWYFKCQSPRQTLAVIPAVHRTKGRRSCSVQLITHRGSWNVDFPYEAFHKSPTEVAIGRNHFGRQGLCLDLQAPGLSAVGALRFGSFTPIRYDIMGPFRYLPFLECRHSVFSMSHPVSGAVHINGEAFVFREDAGYLEGDRGRSFPKEYVWTQCSFPGGSLMLSVADVPLGGFHITGVIGVVFWQGREFRLATYLGARAAEIGKGRVVVRQGGACLTAQLLEKQGRPLRAPTGGAMTRTIHENAACRAFYRFEKGGETLFSFRTPNAAFEYEYPD